MNLKIVATKDRKPSVSRKNNPPEVIGEIECQTLSYAGGKGSLSSEATKALIDLLGEECWDCHFHIQFTDAESYEEVLIENCCLYLRRHNNDDTVSFDYLKVSRHK